MSNLKISLEAARVNANMTQKEAAKRLKTSVKTIQNHESGKTEPTLSMAEKYSALYEIPINNIFFGKSVRFR